MESSLITSVGALVLGGGAAALFWKPLLAGIASIVTSNRAGGEIITSYKEQVMLLKEGNLLLREENDELRERHDKNLRLHYETYRYGRLPSSPAICQARF